VESELRRIRAGVELRSGELEEVRNRLTEAETELVRVRAELDTHGSQLEAMRTRAESAEAETGSALRRAAEAEQEADEARRLAQELVGTDERADEARLALAELRTENERERELSAVTERDLRESLRAEEARRAELEQRLSEVEGSAFAAERAFEELREAQARMRGALRELADPGAPND
jgi:chromosome segregation ATPase